MAYSDRAAARTREERVALNESWCRALNERKAQWMERHLAVAGFRCECADLNCGSRFPVSASEWEEARADPTRFLIAPGHVAADVEIVVKEYRDYWLVEKQNEAAEVAEELE